MIYLANENEEAKPDQTVTVDYKGTFDDGTVFDTSDGKEPLTFQLGKGSVIKGFENAIIGMKVGEKKDTSIMPSDGYGERDERLIQQVPKAMFPPDLELKPGLGLKLQAPTGQIITAMVAEVNDEKVTVDFNHPLAGRTLHFQIRLVSIT